MARHGPKNQLVSGNLGLTKDVGGDRLREGVIDASHLAPALPIGSVPRSGDAVSLLDTFSDGKHTHTDLMRLAGADGEDGASGPPGLNGVASAGIQINLGRAVGQSAVVASVAAYTLGASDGSFIVSANVLVTVSTAHSFTVTVTYTDEGGNARVLTLTFSQITGTMLMTITNITGAGAYEGVPLHIRAKASTTITIATVGTFTVVTYNVEGAITQIA